MLGLVLVAGHEAHREALGAPPAERLGELREVRSETRHLLRVQHVALALGAGHGLQLDARPGAEDGA